MVVEYSVVVSCEIGTAVVPVHTVKAQLFL